MDKEWYKSKAVWGGIFVILGAIAKAGSEWAAGNTPDWMGLLAGIGNGLGILGIRVAM